MIYYIEIIGLSKLHSWLTLSVINQNLIWYDRSYLCNDFYLSIDNSYLFGQFVREIWCVFSNKIDWVFIFIFAKIRTVLLLKIDKMLYIYNNRQRHSWLPCLLKWIFSRQNSPWNYERARTQNNASWAASHIVDLGQYHNTERNVKHNNHSTTFVYFIFNLIWYCGFFKLTILEYVLRAWNSHH